MTSSKASDRNKRLAGMFGGVDPEALAAQAQREKPQERQMTTAPTKGLQTSFSRLEEENLELKQELEKAQVHELDPANVRPSIVQDRFEWQDNDPDFQSLVASIDSDGQKLPILVRSHPTEPGSYQIAYGARRNRACQLLGRSVLAYVRELTDEELILAQGLENNERRNLSFIEQAVYASALSDEGYSRKLICRAIGVANVELVSRMTAIVQQIPADIIRFIGPAPKIGRPSWMSLSELFAERGKAVEAAIIGLKGVPVWEEADSSKRFQIALGASKVAVTGAKAKPQPQKTKLSISGRTLGTIEQTANSFKMVIDTKAEPDFAQFIAAKMTDLLVEFRAREGEAEAED